MGKKTIATIILVQSPGTSRSTLYRFLTDANYKVYKISQPTDLATGLKTIPADLILLDPALPGFNRVNEQINNLAIAHPCPIILLCNEKPQPSIKVPIEKASLLACIKVHLQYTELSRGLTIREARLEAILNYSFNAIAYTDINLRVLKVNLQFLSLFDCNENIYSLSDLLTQPIDKGTCLKQFHLQTILQLEQKEHVMELRHAKGHLLLIRILGKLLDQHNPEHGVVWTLVDISSQPQLVASVFDASGEAVIIFNEDGIIKNANTAMQQLIEYTMPALLNQPMIEILTSTSNQLLTGEILDKVTGQGEWKGELWFCKKPQFPFPARATINCITPNDSIRHLVAIIADISKYKLHEQRLIHRANHDPLTGLPNRNEFFVRINDVLASAKRHQYHVALLYLDLDGFKPINDTLGHGRGDEVLQEVSEKLQHCVREVDTVARLGGDEFSVILNGTSDEQVELTAERLIQSISIQLEESLYLSVSIGISLYPKDTTDPLKLLQYADEAMYKAKQNGKQSFCWHSSDPK